MASFLDPVVSVWLSDIFGSPVIAGIVVLAAFLGYGFFRGWSLELYVIVGVPLIAVLSAILLPPFVFVLVLMALGTVIALGVYRLIRG